MLLLLVVIGKRLARLAAKSHKDKVAAREGTRSGQGGLSREGSIPASRPSYACRVDKIETCMPKGIAETKFCFDRLWLVADLHLSMHPRGKQEVP